MKSFKLQFTPEEIAIFKASKPKGLWIQEYLTAMLLDSKDLLPAGFWKMKPGQQQKWLGIRDDQGRLGVSLPAGNPLEVIKYADEPITTTKLSKLTGVTYQQVWRRLNRSPNAEKVNGGWVYRP